MSKSHKKNKPSEPLYETPSDSRIPNLFFILGIIAISLLACIPLFSGKFMHTHDTLSPLVRLASVYKFLGDGQILVRWVPDLSRGYGLPLFNFYSPLFSYIASAFSFAGIGLISSLNYACILLWICSGLTMYLFAKEFFGKYGGFVSAIAYVYVPYHIVDLYVRGSVAEFTAFPLFPLILWSFYKQAQKPNPLYVVSGAISLGLLLLCHNIMAMIFTPVVITYIFFLHALNPRNGKKALYLNLTGFALGIMLAAFFWLPAIMEKKFSHISGMTSGYFDYQKHFVYLQQLLYSKWGYGVSLAGKGDTMSFQIGAIHLFMTAISFFLIRKILAKSKISGAHVIYFAVIGAITIFFISPSSLPIWKAIPLLQFVQFSWRFLSIIALIVSFFCGSIFLVIKNKKLKKIVFVIITALIILINLPFCKPRVYYEQIKDTLTLPIAAINNPRISAFAHYFTDFTPAWVKTAPTFPAPQQLSILDGDATVKYSEHKAITHQFIVESKTPSTLRFNIFYFPGWEVFVNGIKTDIDFDNDGGLIDFEIPKGTHQIRIKFSNTPLRDTAASVSLFSLLILFIFFILGLLALKRKPPKADLVQDAPEESLPGSMTPGGLRAFWIPACLFVGTLIVYLKTLCPSVYGGDSGEILSAIATLGIAHPTGFPLYMLAGKFFSVILPFGDIAYRVNILSAVFASFTIVVIYFILKKLINKDSICFAGALCFAFSSTLWSHATVARVYIMTCFFMALCFYMILLWSLKRKDKYFYFFAVSLGLGIGTHATMFLTIPMALAMIAMTDARAFLRPAFFKAIVITAAISIALYLYIPIAASRNPIVNWGNPVNLDSFIYYITQQEYSFKIIASTLNNTLKIFFLTLKLFILDFTPLGFIVILCGAAASWKKYKKLLISLFLVITGNVVLMINYGGTEQDIPILFRYLFPSYIAMSILAGLGLHAIYDFVKKLSKYPLLPSLIIMILPLTCLIAHYHQSDRSRNSIVLDYAKNVLDTPPADAILFSVGDAISGPIQYLQAATGYRNDITLIDRELLSRDWYCRYLIGHHPKIIPENILSTSPDKRLSRIIEFNISKKPLFATFIALKEYKYISYGLIYKISPEDARPDYKEVKEINDTLWGHYAKSGLLDPGIYKDHMVEQIVESHAKGKNNLGLYYSSEGHIEDAINEYEESLKYNPGNFASLFNLGQLYMQAGNQERGRALLKKATELNPDFFLQNAGPGGATQSNEYAMMSPISSDEDEKGTASYHIKIGIQYGSVGNHQRAIEEFKKALEIEPEDASIYTLLGNGYMNISAIDAAIEMYQKAIAIDPGAQNANAYLNLGSIFVNMRNDYPKAVFYLEKYVELAPDRTHAAEIQGQIQKIKALINQNGLQHQ